MPDDPRNDGPHHDDKTSSPLPGMLGRLHAAWLMLRDPATPALGKLGVVVIGLGGVLLMVAYGVSPIDLIPELFTGPFGLIDDLILIPLMLWVLSLFMPRQKAAHILNKFRTKKSKGSEEPQMNTDTHG
jgi:uncharacterized membrane protein YkvA (DUF1232 family)